jgi:D-glycero-D-manno-heptose 1,7-bisphosphate phosphatase
MHTAIFLDRDGVIIENRANYVRNWSDVELFPQALEALRRISYYTIKVVIITNQSAVGRGLISLQDAQEINHRIEQVINENGGRIDGFFMCPHSPDEACFCRKPKPGLFFQAAEALDINLPASIMVGDALTDIIAAKNAGILRTFLVKTGRGASQSALPEMNQLKDVQIFNTLLEAVQVQPDFSR